MPKKKETIEDILDRLEEDLQKVRDYVWDKEEESDDQIEDDFEDDDDIEDDDE
jgi:hypothetical protein